MSREFIFAENSACAWKMTCTSRRTELSCLRRRARAWKIRLQKASTTKDTKVHEDALCVPLCPLWLSLFQRVCHERPNILLQFAQRRVLDIHHVSGAIVPEADAGMLGAIERHVIQRVLCCEVRCGQVVIS